MLLGLLSILIYGAGILTILYIISLGLGYLRFQKIKETPTNPGNADDSSEALLHNADLFCQRALFFHERKCFAAAIGDYSKALELNKEHSIAGFNRDRAFARQSPSDELPEDFTSQTLDTAESQPEISPVPEENVKITTIPEEPAQETPPSIPAAAEKKAELPKDHLKIAILLVRKGKLEEALAEFSLAIKQDGTSSAAYMNRGITYARINNNEMALDDLNKAIDIDPKIPAAFMNRGIVYLKIHNYESATNDFNTAVELNPKYAVAYKKRGEAHIKQNLFDNAVEDFSEAIRVKPDYADAYISRGKAYTQRGMHDQAKADYITAKQFKPDIAQVYLHRGKSRLKADEILQALDYFKIACDLGDQNACSEYRKAKAKITG